MGATDAADAEIGRAIRARRRTLGLTQTALGRAVGVSWQQIQKYESGVNRIAASTLWRIAGALACEPASLLPAPLGAPARRDPLARLAGTDGGLELARAWLALGPRGRAAVLEAALALGPVRPLRQLA